MIKIKDKKRIKIKDLNIKVAQKMYDTYRNDPDIRFYEEEFKRQIYDDFKIETKDFKALMKYMEDKNYISSHQEGISEPRYFLITTNLIDFVENLPNVNDE